MPNAAVEAFQGKAGLWSSQLTLPREVPLFTVQFSYTTGRKNELPSKLYLYAGSKAEALALVEYLEAGTYKDNDGKTVRVTSSIDVLKTQTRLIHTTREDEED